MLSFAQLVGAVRSLALMFELFCRTESEAAVQRDFQPLKPPVLQHTDLNETHFAQCRLVSCALQG